MIPTIATIPVYPYSFELRVYPPVKTYLIGDDEIDIPLLTSGWLYCLVGVTHTIIPRMLSSHAPFD